MNDGVKEVKNICIMILDSVKVNLRLKYRLAIKMCRAVYGGIEGVGLLTGL